MAAIRVMVAAVVTTEQQPPSLHRSLQRSAAPTSHEAKRGRSALRPRSGATRRSIVEHSSVYSVPLDPPPEALFDELSEAAVNPRLGA